MPNLIKDAGVVGPILTQRTAYASLYVPEGANGWVQFGLGGSFTSGKLSFFRPTVIIEDFKPSKLNIAGEELFVFGAYGDAGTDEIAFYLPKYRHLHGSETIQGETFPNLYTLRGTSYRDVTKWYKGVDRLLKYGSRAVTYTGSHMRAWKGNKFITQRITNYRDAIQYVHDQSIFYINKGAKRDELPELVTLPKQFANDPWLMEYYGTVAHSVRNIYNGYLGWYQGDATELARPTFGKLSVKYVKALGGSDDVIEIAEEAIEKEDWGWAAELLTHVTRMDPDNKKARDLKAKALRSWAYKQTNIYWRTLL